MIATISNFGNSLGVIFPESLLKNVHISEDDNVEFFVNGNSIIMKRQESRKHLTTKERISSFCGSIGDTQVSETDWGKPQGKEVW